MPPLFFDSFGWEPTAKIDKLNITKWEEVRRLARTETGVALNAAEKSFESLSTLQKCAALDFLAATFAKHRSQMAVNRMTTMDARFIPKSQKEAYAQLKAFNMMLMEASVSGFGYTVSICKLACCGQPLLKRVDARVVERAPDVAYALIFTFVLTCLM